MHGKFPAAQWVEHCTAFAVRVRIEILYRGTCRFVLSFFFFFMISFLIIFRSFVAIPILYQSNMLAGVSVGFPPLISKFTLSKCTLKLRTCIGTLLNFFFLFFFVVSFWVFYGNPLPGGLTFCFSVWFLFNFFFFEAPLLLPFYTSLKVVWSIFVYYSSRFTTLAKVFFHLLFVKITVWWLPRREPQVFCSLSSPIVPCTAA